MSTRSAVAFALAACTLWTVLAGSAPAERPRALVQGALGRRLDEVLRRYHEYGLSGTVLVAKDGSVVLHEGFGFAGRERQIPNGLDTLYEIASLTKTFTAAAILRLEMGAGSQPRTGSRSNWARSRRPRRGPRCTIS